MTANNDDGVEVTPTSPAPDATDDVKIPSEGAEDAGKVSRRKAKTQENDDKFAAMQVEIDALKGQTQADKVKLLKTATAEKYGITKLDEDAYDEEFKKLTESGMSEEAAVETTMRLMSSGVIEKERRDNRRKDAALLPASSSKQASNDAFPQVSKDEFANLMKSKRKELGENAGMKYYEDYCNYQKSQGRADYN